MNASTPAHRIAVLSQVTLAISLAGWTQFSALGAAAAVILLLPLRSLMRGNTYTAGWVSMLVVIYCAFLLADAYAHPQNKLVSIALAALAALNFLSLILYVRLRARERSAQPPAAAAE